MNVLYFHQYFTTPKGSGGTRSYFFARELIKNGHKVKMVCLNDVRSNTGLKGEFKNGKRNGIVDGIEIIEFDINYSNNKNLFDRSIIFLKYSFLSTCIALNSDFDIIFATSTPLTAGIPGIVSKFIKRTTFIFEVRDLWPLLPQATGTIKNPIILILLSLLESITYFSSNFCIGLAPGICEGIEQKGINRSKIVNIPNGCDLEIFKPISKDQIKRPDLIPGLEKIIKKEDFVAAFTGAHGICNGLDAVLDVANELKKLGREDIKILFIGEGSCKKKLEERAETEGLTNCFFLPSIAKYELAKIISRSVHVGLMVLRDIPAFYRGTSPNKFFDYISCGIPVINNYPGWIASLINEYNIGLTVTPNKPKEFANALVTLSNNPNIIEEQGFNARRLAENNFSREKLASKYLKTLENALKT